MSGDHLLELLFTQSLDGFFFMMLDEPIEWKPDTIGIWGPSRLALRFDPGH